MVALFIIEVSFQLTFEGKFHSHCCSSTSGASGANSIHGRLQNCQSLSSFKVCVSICLCICLSAHEYLEIITFPHTINFNCLLLTEATPDWVTSVVLCIIIATLSCNSIRAMFMQALGAYS